MSASARTTEDTHLGPGVYGGLETHRGQRENCSAPDCATYEAEEPFMLSDVTVELVQHIGDDQAIANAARVSTAGERVFQREMIEDGVATPGRNRGLINYLMRDRHGSPFEHNSMTFFIQAPIFVFREFHRHRAGWSYNEESARYREMGQKFYVPGPDRPLQQIGKPGAYEYVPGTEEQHRVVWDELSAAYAQCWDSYQRMLAAGVAREVARAALPVGLYSSMYATCNARSLMHFLSLRTKDERAKVPSFPQREIEMVAEKMEAEWARLMPLSHDAFNCYGRVAP